MRRCIVIMIVIITILILMPLSVLAYGSGGVIYNDHDYNAIAAFLNGDSSTPGQTNAQALGYTISDPATWIRVIWTTEGTEKRVEEIGWGYTGIAGALDVSDFTSLKTLDCTGNELTSLDVSGCTSLTSLICCDNELTSLDISGCTGLTSLDCSYNWLDSLDISGCTDLTSLNCSFDGLISLDISSCTGLTSLSCSGNWLTTLDLSGCTGLTLLDCASNELESLDASYSASLDYLYCMENPLTSISANIDGASVELAATDGYVKLHYSVYYDAEHVRHVSRYETAAVPDSLPFSGWTGTQDGSPFSADSSNIALTPGASYDISASFASSGTYNDYDLTAMQKYLNQEPLEGPNYIQLGYDVDDPSTWTGVTWTPSPEGLRIIYVDLENDSIGGTLDLSNCTSLRSIDLSNCYNLSGLYCWECGLDSLNVSGCSNLEELICYSNGLTELDLSGLSYLWYVDCEDNSLETLTAAGCEGIDTFYCARNQLTSIDLSDSTLLSDFSVTGNPWEQITVNTGGYNIAVAANGDGTIDLSNDSGELTAMTSANGSSVFVDWTEGGTQVDTEPMYTLPGGANRNLTANFASFVTYDGNAAGSGSVPADTASYEMGETVTVRGNTGGLVKSGYAFGGWNTESDGSGSQYFIDGPASFGMPGAPVTLYAQWLEEDHSVTYYPNGATGGAVPSGPVNYLNGSEVTVLGNTGLLVRTDYTFTGWNTLDNGTGTHYAPDGIITMPEDNVSLYAEWKHNYTLTYSANSATSGAAPAAAAYYEGQTVTVSDNTGNLARTGYSFTGWNTSSAGSGTHYSPGSTLTMPSGSFTIYAEWKHLYSVTYYANNATGGTVPAAAAYNEGSTVTVSGNTGGLALAGYAFDGWNTDAGGAGTRYAPGDTFIMPSGRSFSLYAQWKKAYNSNDMGKIQAFLAQGSYTAGMTNAQQLGYDVNNPETWSGITWAFSGGEWRVSQFSWANKSLAGSLDLSGCPALQTLDVDRNYLNGINISGCTNLSLLWFYNNSVSSIDLSGLSALTELDCGGNGITSLPLSGLSGLKELYCDQNPIASLDVNACPLLESLDCSDCGMSSLSLSACTGLKELDCSNNMFVSLTVSPALYYLDCRGNRMTQVNVNLPGQYVAAVPVSLTASGPGYVGMYFSVLDYNSPKLVATPMTSVDFNGWTGPAGSSAAEFIIREGGAYTAAFTYNQGAYLSGVNLTAGALNKPFVKTTYKYNINLGENEGSVTITPVKMTETLGLKITGGAVSGESTTVTLANGKSAKVTVKVMYGRTSKTYTFTVTRAKSANNLLGSLSADAGSFNTAFDPNITNYTLYLPEGIKTTTIRAAAAAAGLAKISPASKKVTLNNGASTNVKITVTSQSGAKKVYVIRVERAASTDAALKSLKISGRGCALSPGFSPGQTAYNVTMPASNSLKSSVTLSFKPNGYKAVVTIDGVKKSSYKVTLLSGQSVVVHILVTAQNTGVARDYAVTVTRP